MEVRENESVDERISRHIKERYEELKKLDDNDVMMLIRQRYDELVESKKSGKLSNWFLAEMEAIEYVLGLRGDKDEEDNSASI